MESPITPMMPGSFHFDQAILTKTNAHSSLFLPPQSPSLASSLSSSYQNLSRTRSDSTDRSRKRQRIDRTPYTLQNETEFVNSPWSHARSPSPLINYRLAGGIDTPRIAHYEDNDFEQDSQQDHRRNRFVSSVQHVDGYFPHTPTMSEQESKQRMEILSTPDRFRLGRVMWSLTSGVAAGVFNFCWNTAFRGFQAGAGEKYEIQPDTPNEIGDSMWSNTEEQYNPFNAQHWGKGIPGGFVEGYHHHPQQLQQQTTPTRPEYPTRSDSWVMVTPLEDREQSPTRKKPRSTTNRPISRANIATRPRLTPSRPSLTNASYASPRANNTPDRLQTSRPPSSEGHRRTRSSVASPRQPGNLQQHSRQNVTNPTSPEVLRFEKKIRRKERVQDESMQRLHQQMQDMIRQGKQALNTTVEIVDDDTSFEIEDEGYAEGDYDNGEKTEMFGGNSQW